MREQHEAGDGVLVVADVVLQYVQFRVVVQQRADCCIVGAALFEQGADSLRAVWSRQVGAGAFSSRSRQHRL